MCLGTSLTSSVCLLLAFECGRCSLVSRSFLFRSPGGFRDGAPSGHRLRSGWFGAGQEQAGVAKSLVAAGGVGVEGADEFVAGVDDDVVAVFDDGDGQASPAVAYLQGSSRR